MIQQTVSINSARCINSFNYAPSPRKQKRTFQTRFILLLSVSSPLWLRFFSSLKHHFVLAVMKHSKSRGYECKPRLIIIRQSRREASLFQRLLTVLCHPTWQLGRSSNEIQFRFFALRFAELLLLLLILSNKPGIRILVFRSMYVHMTPSSTCVACIMQNKEKNGTRSCAMQFAFGVHTQPKNVYGAWVAVAAVAISLSFETWNLVLSMNCKAALCLNYDQNKKENACKPLWAKIIIINGTLSQLTCNRCALAYL